MAQLDPRAIQERIREARKEAGLTQQELADLLERHKRSVENYENVRVPAWAELTKIARVLDRPIEWFLHGDRPDEQVDLAGVIERLDAIDRKLDVANLDQRLSLIEAELTRLAAAVGSPSR